MRVFLLPVLLASALGVGLATPAAADVNAHIREQVVRDRPAIWTEQGPQFERRRIARATINDEDDGDYRPRRASREAAYDRDEDENARPHRRQQVKPKAAQRHKKRGKMRPTVAAKPETAKPARKQAAPAWTKRSLSNSGPSGSGQTGIASFYWQPQRLASGGWFNPDAMTAAHKTLPFGTLVRVTHLGNGRSVDVRINDRGPYIAGRVIDLSKAAAGVLGMTAQGIARIKMEILGR